MRCSICNSTLKPFLPLVKDHMVSKEEFSILQCPTCKTLSTNPVPTELVPYYDSDQYISHHSEQFNPFSILYKILRTVNINNKLNILNSYVKGNSLLDVGCGTGNFLHKAHLQQFKAEGVEVDPDARNKAIQHTKLPVHSSLEVVQGTFHVITLWHVLEHTTNPTTTISLLKEKLTDNGILIIAVPNYTSWDAKKYSSFWAGYDVPRHLFHFCPHSMEYLAKQLNIKRIKTLPMYFDAYYVSLLSEKYIRNSWSNALNAIRSGYISNRKAARNGNYSSLIYIFEKK